MNTLFKNIKSITGMFRSNFVSLFKHWRNKHSRNLYYWFEVKFVYTKDNTQIMYWTNQLGVKKLKSMANKRALAKAMQPLHKNEKIKKYLCNGELNIEVICYLGRYSKD